MIMSDDPIKGLASTLFVADKDDRIHLEYPFLFLCIFVGLFVRAYSNFIYNRGKNNG